ncbi:hypothetical protein [Microbulbifer halophilus]|uniref:Cation:proton antiporter n=1 Tax=Microbulbifer halophilus TaxID=453963 RepID=A0ABW5EAA1_9GAMM|nr:hypothetical protein [Microbulbifer halophilus]MCW8125549.1 hypothetical protein [Microbulbifer halophilus]
MTAFLLFSAGFLIALGSLALYLASPNQRLLSRPFPRRPLAIGGSVALVAALSLQLQYSGAAAAVFIVVTGAMLIWTLLPMAIAYWRHRRQANNNRRIVKGSAR